MMVFAPPWAVTELSVTTVSLAPPPLIVKVPPWRVTAFTGARRVGVALAAAFRPKLSQLRVP